MDFLDSDFNFDGLSQGLAVMRMASSAFWIFFGLRKYVVKGSFDMLRGALSPLGALASPVAHILPIIEILGGISMITGNFFRLGALTLAGICFGSMIFVHKIWDDDQFLAGMVRLLLTSFYIGLALTGTGPEALV